MTTYVCTCGNKYTSPLPLNSPPLCSGNPRSHTPRTMKEKK